MTYAIDAEAVAVDLDELESAEDFLEFFDVAYDAAVVQVNRLHILQRFHDYLAQLKKNGATEAFSREGYRQCLLKAYSDFVLSDAMTEKVFRVLKRASGITTIPVSSIGRATRVRH